MTPLDLPNPFDFGSWGPWVAALRTEEFGAWIRLSRHAWLAEGRLPSDPEALAALAGVPASRWAQMSPRVLHALGAAPDATALVCHAIVGAVAQARDVIERARDQRRAAGRASAAARAAKARPPDPNDRSTVVERPFNDRSASDADARLTGNFEARSRSACAQSYEHDSGAQALTRERVVGVLSQAVETQAQARMEGWRREQVEGLLRRELKPFEKRIRRGLEVEVRHIAAQPSVQPWMAEIAVARLIAADAKEAVRRPIGYLLSTLGLFDGGEPMTLETWDMPIRERWEKLAASKADVSKQLAAIEAAAKRAEQAGAKRAGGVG